MAVRGTRNVSTSRDGTFGYLSSNVVQRVPLANTSTLSTTISSASRPEGSFIYNQFDNTLYIRDRTPAWQALGGGSGSQSLFQTLAVGNQTGSNGVSGIPTHIVVSPNDLITGTNGDLNLSSTAPIVVDVHGVATISGPALVATIP